MVKVDHSKTEAALDRIAATLHSQAGVLKNYFKELDPKEDQAMYSAEYLKGLADKALEKLVETARKNAITFEEALEDAKECERANDAAIDFTDPVMTGILAAIDTIKDDRFTEDAGEAYSSLNGAGKIVAAALEELKGQRNALELVKNKIEAKGLHMLPEWKPYFYGLDIFDGLELNLTGATSSPKSALYYVNATAELRKIAKTLGLTLKESDLDLGAIDSSVYLTALSQAAGV